MRNPLHSFLRVGIVFPRVTCPMGTVQHTQTFTAQYQVCWFVSSIETDRLAERGKPGNYILQQCSSGKISSDIRWTREHRDKIQTCLYSVRFESSCIFFLCVYEPMLWLRNYLHTPYKDMCTVVSRM